MGIGLDLQAAKDAQAVLDGARADDLTFNGGRGLTKDEGRVGDFCQTWTGTRFYPLDPRPEDVKIEDLIFGLGNMCRYNGQVRFYSVAEHSVLVSKLVAPEHALAALMHDAPEFLMADMTRPFKRAIGRDNAYFKIEEQIWEKAIAPKFGLPAKLPQEVINADTELLGLEKQVLLVRSDPWYLPFPTPTHLQINCWQPPYSQWCFLRRFCDLTGYMEGPIRKRIESLMMEDRRGFNAQFSTSAPGSNLVRSMPVHLPEGA